ncbi:MAG TPA: hypothetical protein VLG12_02075 [Candidatus Saccharimonadales bacterium]|nr:hypothetical protein [Candidatus Saccharimonadales bacterium]
MLFSGSKIEYKRKKVLVITLLIIAVQVIFLGVFQLYLSGQKQTLQQKYSFSDKSHTYKNLADQQLTLQEYKQEIQEMTNLIDIQNPRVALNRLKEEMTTNPKILFGCHEILHAMGRIAYKKYNDLSTAMEYRDEVCVGGYIHGVIEGYFATSKPNFSTMDMACSKYADNSYMRWDCYHGMGHGLMLYTSNDVPQALMGCNVLNKQFDQTACYSGTYMENFNADTINHPSKYLNLKNPFSICAKDTKHPEQCYTNAPFAFLNYYNNDYKGALEWCDEAPQQYRNICYEGVGSQITRRNTDSKTIEVFCRSGEEKKIASCIIGAADWYIGQYNSMAKAQALCQQFTVAGDRSVCLDAVENNRPLFAE